MKEREKKNVGTSPDVSQVESSEGNFSAEHTPHCICLHSHFQLQIYFLHG